MTPETMRAAKEASRLRGVLDGQDLARVFAWMRPNDLIWNYWVNNYLLGNQPPAFDILFWNADTTSLPARLHHDYVDMYLTNPFVNANKLTLNGAAIDMSRVKADAYVVAGVTDHITPWKAVYRTAKIFGDKTTFVFSNSGHLQSLLNPPTNPKASFVAGRRKGAGRRGVCQRRREKERQLVATLARLALRALGRGSPCARKPGSNRHPAGAAAPGTYVFD